MAFKASPSSQHQHCTDEAQKAETELSEVNYIIHVLDACERLYIYMYIYIKLTSDSTVNLLRHRCNSNYNNYNGSCNSKHA